MEKGDWTQDLIDAITGSNAAVYVGTSAGAILMGSSMETACWKVRLDTHQFANLVELSYGGNVG